MNAKTYEMTEEERREARRIGKVITRLRMRMGMNGREFAKAVGYSAGYISQLETAVRLPRLTTLMTIAYECGLSFSELLVMIAETEYA